MSQSQTCPDLCLTLSMGLSDLFHFNMWSSELVIPGKSELDQWVLSSATVILPLDISQKGVDVTAYNFIFLLKDGQKIVPIENWTKATTRGDNLPKIQKVQDKRQNTKREIFLQTTTITILKRNLKSEPMEFQIPDLVSLIKNIPMYRNIASKVWASRKCTPKYSKFAHLVSFVLLLPLFWRDSKFPNLVIVKHRRDSTSYAYGHSCAKISI